MLKKLIIKIRNKLFLNAIRSVIHEEICNTNLVCDVIRTELCHTENLRIIFHEELSKFFTEHKKWEEKENHIFFDSLIHEKLDLFFTEHRKWFDIVNHELHKYIFDQNFLINDATRRLLAIRDMHQMVFPQFKDINRGKDIVLVGAGPTLNDFIPIENCIYVGLNRAFKYDKVKFDYLFAIDRMGIIDFHEDFFAYRNGDCIKFIGDQNIDERYQIPEPWIKGENIYRYATMTGILTTDKFTYHIDSEPLGNFTTVSLSAMQVLLYTHPKKIYLVGIDCSTGHFTGETRERWKDELQQASNDAILKYKELKKFLATYYPDTEIISVNPVGLKGIFKDWYQSEGEEPK